MGRGLFVTLWINMGVANLFLGNKGSGDIVALKSDTEEVVFSGIT